MRMADEARLVTRVFAQHQVDCTVQPPPQSFQTAAIRVYRLKRGDGVSVSRVIALADELDEALTEVRRTEVRCRFDRLPLSLEVPRPDPQPLMLLDVLRQLHKQRSNFGLEHRLLTVVGEASSYSQADVMLLDLVNPNSPHVLVAGTTGSGKTNLLASMVLSLAVLHSPQQLNLVLLDPKGIDLPPLSGLPQVLGPVATEPDEAVRSLARVVAELERRKREGGGQSRLVVVIDELAELADVAGAQVEAHIRRILQVGRGLGVHMIGATQKPLASVIGSLVKANFPVRLVGRVASTDDAKVAAGVPGTGAERLQGKGAFLLLRGGEMKRVQTHLLPHEHLLANVETAQRYWRKYARPTWPLSQEPVQDSRPMVTVIAAPASAQAYPTWLADLVANYIREHGQPPSQRAVQQAYRDETGQMLNWEGIKAAIADGTTQTGGATHA